MHPKRHVSKSPRGRTSCAAHALLGIAVPLLAGALRAQTAAPATAVPTRESAPPTEAARRAAAAYLVESGAERYGWLSYAVSRRAMAGVVARRRPALAAHPDRVRAIVDSSFSWEAYREHAVRQLAAQHGEAQLQQGLAFYATPGGRRLAASTAGLDRELATVDAPLDSFAARAAAARARNPLSAAELATTTALLDSPAVARLLGAERGVWLASALAARADLERRYPGLSGGKIDPKSGGYSFEVDRHAEPIPGGPSPAYPDALRAANIAGEVVAEFIVNMDGRADTTSLRVVRSTHPLFTAAVGRVLPDLRFTPAEVLGHKVRQRVSRPFQFALARE